MMTPGAKRAALLFAIIYGLLALYVVLLLYSDPVQQGMLEFVSFFTEFGSSDLVWIFLLVFLFMAVGNSTNIPVGIPAVYFFAKSIPTGDTFWMLLALFALAAGFGASIGEIGVYALGRGAARVLRGRDSVKNLQYFVRLLTDRRSLTPLLVYFFGLTPLPDQLIIIPLGVARYPLKRVLFPCALGKATFSLIISLGATLFHQAGPETVTIASLIQEGMFLALILSILVVCVSINWEPIFEKYTRKTPKVTDSAAVPAPKHDNNVPDP
jgi:membrane protein YqaA with SNARE-associated domain